MKNLNKKYVIIGLSAATVILCVCVICSSIFALGFLAKGSPKKSLLSFIKNNKQTTASYKSDLSGTLTLDDGEPIEITSEHETELFVDQESGTIAASNIRDRSSLTDMEISGGRFLKKDGEIYVTYDGITDDFITKSALDKTWVQYHKDDYSTNDFYNLADQEIGTIINDSWDYDYNIYLNYIYEHQDALIDDGDDSGFYSYKLILAQNEAEELIKKTLPYEMVPDIYDTFSAQSELVIRITWDNSEEHIAEMQIALEEYSYNYPAYNTVLYFSGKYSINIQNITKVGADKREINIPQSTELIYAEDFVRSKQLIIGDLRAPVTMIQGLSVGEHFSGKFYIETFTDLQAEFVDNSQVVVTLLPMDIGYGAGPGGFKALLCGNEQDKLLEVYEVLMQEAYANEYTSDVLTNAYYSSLVEKIEGLDMQAFEECLEDSFFTQAVEGLTSRSEEYYDFTGSPSFYLANRTGKFSVIEGAMDYEVFVSEIEDLLTNKIERPV